MAIKWCFCDEKQGILLNFIIIQLNLSDYFVYILRNHSYPLWKKFSEGLAAISAQFFFFKTYVFISNV